MDDVDKVKLKDAFDELFSAEKAVQVAEAALSEKMKHVLETYGRGPWRFQGRVFSIGKRNDAYFFKGLGEKTIETVE